MRNTTIGLLGSAFLLSTTIFFEDLVLKVVGVVIFTYLMGFFSYPFFNEKGY